MNDKDIKQAFEDIEPSNEVLERMLSKILETPRQPADDNNQEKPLIQTRRKRSIWHVVVPVAASLVLLAGIGVLTLQQTTNLDTNASFSDAAPLAEQSDELMARNETLRDESPLEPYSSSANPEATDTDATAESSLMNEENTATRFPTLSGPSLGRLYIIDEGRSAQSFVDSAEVGEKIEEGIARNAITGDEMRCIIYSYQSNEVIYYAIQFAGEDVYYKAATFAR